MSIQDWPDRPMSPETERRSDPEREALQERIERVVCGQFDQIKTGSFASELPGIVSLNVLRREQQADQLYVFVRYEYQGGREQGDMRVGGETWTITRKGEILGPVPRALREAGVDRKAIINEILQILERVDGASYYEADISVFPEQDEQEKPAESVAGSKPRGPRAYDSRRLEELRRDPDTITGVIQKGKGFNGYVAFLLAQGEPGAKEVTIILENPWRENAYVEYQTGDRISVTREEFALMSGEQQRAIVSNYITPFLETITTKQEARALGATVRHHVGERWPERFAEERRRHSAPLPKENRPGEDAGAARETEERQGGVS
ncbi:MAG: hypothetical protein COV10_00995 [Candidatus Vogelbacteria bacterium CG10_big_fil_rev_8_21_14_0_10_51_16]|uniref:Uncharacterized protein n=1 Tax=Candidatus Vogelbacteria bacterium CG10_big_fil_rev_8_21_14_0_10_51_16 TaxID=1975045 RepID=A0A2H0RF49_9BACT|nr:MAG: hypothetical protein COV10_00995 [Candidatus Vogelbacteria bacterium CG10_big_fil_rev_8_21_14_0_10_51_16]